jgi:multimeric flavodoxin WrbA
MRVLLLYDETSQDFEGVNLAEQVKNSIQDAGFTVKSRKIISSEFKPCTGCLGCWVKTPGLCVLPGDEANQINSDMVNAELLVVLTLILYGGYSIDIKKYLDRMIPNISPFFTVISGETHHQKRYNSYPSFVGIGYNSNISTSEQSTFETLIRRNSINFHAPKSLALVIANENDVSKTITTLSDFLMGVLS